MSTVMPPGFHPRGRGRRPIADIVPVLLKCKETPGLWVRFEEPDNIIRSLCTQLDSIEDIEFSRETLKGAPPALYVRYAGS